MPSSYDLLAYLGDPMGTLAAHRGERLIVGADAMPLLIDHADVRAALADPAMQVCFVDVLGALGVTSGPFIEWMARSPLDHDGPAHRSWRAFMNRAFTPARVEQIRPVVAAEADRLARLAAEQGEIELMAELADVLPALGLCELIGVPVEDRPHFARLARTIGMGFRPLELVAHLAEVDAAVVELQRYAATLLEARLAAPRADLVTHLATTCEAAGYDLADAAAFLAGLVFAGNDTTRNQIGWMVVLLLEAPELWDRVGDGTWATDAAVEELLRVRSTVAALARRTTSALDLGGTTVPAGTTVMLSLWGADSDPAAYADPGRIDPTRVDPAPHLAFGHGAHHCLGAALARLELQEALRAVCSAWRAPRPIEPVEVSPPVGINGPVRLRLRLEPREP